MTHITSTTSTAAPEAVLMRRAAAPDAARVQVLARLDDKRLPVGPFLVAEMGGEIVAARSLSTGTVVADPFRPTRDAVAMLSLRAAQVSGSNELQRLRGNRWATGSQDSLEETAVAA